MYNKIVASRAPLPATVIIDNHRYYFARRLFFCGVATTILVAAALRDSWLDAPNSGRAQTNACSRKYRPYYYFYRVYLYGHLSIIINDFVLLRCFSPLLSSPLLLQRLQRPATFFVNNTFWKMNEPRATSRKTSHHVSQNSRFGLFLFIPVCAYNIDVFCSAIISVS